MFDKNKESIDLFPLTGWDIGVQSEQQVILFCPHYIATAFDSPDNSQKGQTLVIPVKTARELAKKLLELSDRLESGDVAIPEHQKN